MTFRSQTLLARLSVAVWLSTCAAASPAQLRAIDAPIGEPWRHAGSGASFPTNTGDLQRTAIRDTGQAELDVIVTYKSSDDRDELTFYFFKTQIVSAPLWFDRALDAVMLRPGLTPSGARPEPQIFEPQPGRGKVGLRASLPIQFGPFRSSAIAALPVGAWLLKVRLSSRDPNLERLNALLSTALQELPLPAVSGEPAAQAVTACADALSFAAIRVAPKTKDTSAQILAASLVGGTPRKAQTYCRDRPGTANLGVYRGEGSRDAYVAAITDAGRALIVERGFAIGDGRSNYSLSALELGRTLIFHPLSALADPAQALAYVMREQPVAITDFSKGKIETTILSDAFKR